MSKVRRITRGASPLIGKYVVAECRTVRGGDGRYAEDWTRSLFPVDQSKVATHPRHPSGFCMETGARNACISPSVSFYSDLCSYAGFRWEAPRVPQA